MKSAEIPMIDFSLNGQPVQALPGESIWQVAQRVGVDIPHLCHKPGLPTAGKSTFAIYGQADGTGSAGSAAIAFSSTATLRPALAATSAANIFEG